MKSPLRILVAVLLVTGATCWFLAHHTHAQVSAPAMTGPSVGAPMDAEKEALWNSPDMLRARAWLTEYCNTSLIGNLISGPSPKCTRANAEVKGFEC